MEAVVAEAAVLRVDEVELPQCPVVAGDGGAHVAAAHGGEQGVHLDPVARRVGGQRLGDHLAAGLGCGEDVADALALDLFDPAELVE
ncbi:MAG: hypothetical protein ACRDRV_21025, partial [Pseudonocardiaceae bacterium]